MSTQTARGAPLRGYRRRKALPDLNSPPCESRDREGTSNDISLQEVQARQQGSTIPPAPIDVEAIDDDVIESSPRAFAEAKNNSRRNHGRSLVVDLDSGRSARLTNNNCSKRRRVSPNSSVTNCDVYINLESTSNSMRETVSVPQPPPPRPPPPKEPIFTCPICMGPLVEEMSTKCGHIFCKGCIRAAISAQAKCPTCRKKVTAKELFRVFLPATS
ncbi:E3 ubiquitin-protein ligase RNF4-like isoform X2 [Mangifera indica]|uniref:E3 ubiquitin-protein ligase RNF4-like isoform X2 n=1 Tax=Mangifera indica TaxID=29780 RepID=UPI001CF9D239|nr:E3 ubiquitin-protein ligase RNF4-like isoform X2 [Mangifera indica]XP_044494214.1 E3 ubiquitin-protein ligase RNF4-like isoform X2 [Mangifera indica]